MKKRCFNCMREYEEQYEVCPFCGYVDHSGPEEPFQLSPGEILNRRYIVGTIVDSGGFGIIYRAWDAQMEQMVAIKEYYPGGMVSRTPGNKDVIVYSGKNRKPFQKGKERFLVEARYAAALSHPDIVAIYDFFEENNTAYIVMEYLDGVSLKDYMREKGGRLSSEEISDIALHVLGALAEIHGQGIIHRDISPDNIFICSSRRIKVIDFGAARFSGGDKENEYSAIVKPGYAPAEQYQTKSRQGKYTDLYALGACMYHALTGVKPQESLSRFMNDELEEPRALNPDIPEYMNDIIIKAMAMDADSRFQTDEEFQEALASHIAPQIPAPGPVKKPQEDPDRPGGGLRKILKLSAAMILLLVLCGGGYFGITRYTRLVNMGSREEIQFYVKSSQKDYYEKIADDYEEDNKGKKVTVAALKDDTYKKEVSEKLKENKAIIFISDDFEESELDSADNMEKYVVKEMGEDDFYYYSDYYKDNAETRMPLSFSVPFILENKELGKEIADNKLNGIDDLKAKSGKDYLVKESVAAQAKNLAGENSDAELDNQIKGEEGVPSEKGIKKFQDKKAAYYITDWADYKALINDEEHYMDRDIWYPTQSMGVSLSEYISILDKGNKQNVMAAEEFVMYMAQNQENYFREERDTVLLPLNKKAIKRFCAIWSLNLKSSGSEADGDTQFTNYLEKCTIPKDE